jgi:hypothetical protein
MDADVSELRVQVKGTETNPRRFRFYVLLAVLAILVLCCSGCASDNWRSIDTGREITFQVVSAIDAIQTAQIQHEDNIHEAGPLARAVMGPEPTTRDVAMYFSTLAISHYLIARALPPKWRDWFQNTTVVYHTMVVSKNCLQFDMCPR